MPTFEPVPMPIRIPAVVANNWRHTPRFRMLSAMLYAMGLHGTSVLAGGPLPNGGQFVAGAGTISSNRTGLNITQSTPRAIIDWRSFSIGNENSVSVNNGSGATLSRVTGTARSVIDGRLSATGSFYLINPQGVLIGASGVVTTGGRFVASTLDVGNDAFMSGGSLTLTGSCDAAVVNLGKISSSGGDVFLISRKLTANDGSILAPNGTAELATGAQVLLKDSSSGPQVFVQAGTPGDVVNTGTIRAVQIHLEAADGNVFALAGKQGELHATGTTTRDGHVWLVAERGTAHQHDLVVATNAEGSGGTVDTNANALHLDDARVKAAQWNVRAPEFNAGPHNATTLSKNLTDGTSVTVDTSGSNGSSGDINMLSTLRWRGDASLTLNANHSVTLGSITTISNKGAGHLTLRADASGIDNDGSIINRGTIDWSKSTGVVSALYDMNGTYAPGTIRSNATWLAAPYSGLKTQVTAYQLVNSINDLSKVSQNLSGIYALGKDVNAGTASAQVEPIGIRSETGFAGQFDGFGHLIRNVRVFDSQQAEGANSPLGLFATIAKSGVIRNLVLADASANGISGPLGVLAGRSAGLITYVFTSGSVLVYGIIGNDAGGLVGVNTGVISRSGSSVDVGSQGWLGGLVGENIGTITQSYASGAVGGGSHGHSGGLIGGNSGLIRQSYATGYSSATSNGGLVDFNGGTIEESFAAAKVDQVFLPTYRGGIASRNSGHIATDVYWDRQATGESVGVGSGTQVPSQNGLSTAQMSMKASFGPTWNFGENGTWVIPLGYQHPVLQWQLAN
ncbi:filamentous hemagglutinin-like protein [Caballeronia arationis]|uniref:two-partner secretion domain-containing protein n=1 Tax=Caballeronia arationis TaxID=1777142 RepID=UPI00074C5744|nr:filamentous hemagglutinin N-terminal domain-containing protein [Caballeronia arationis]SAL06253.1 filamentous hemagglutinin-like protein [Caballeronia arationis]